MTFVGNNIASAIISRIAKSVGNCLEIKERTEIISGGCLDRTSLPSVNSDAFTLRCGAYLLRWMGFPSYAAPKLYA